VIKNEENYIPYSLTKIYS